jgi:hypothetical protein
MQVKPLPGQSTNVAPNSLHPAEYGFFAALSVPDKTAAPAAAAQSPQLLQLARLVMASGSEGGAGAPRPRQDGWHRLQCVVLQLVAQRLEALHDRHAHLVCVCEDAGAAANVEAPGAQRAAVMAATEEELRGLANLLAAAAAVSKDAALASVPHARSAAMNSSSSDGRGIEWDGVVAAMVPEQLPIAALQLAIATAPQLLRWADRQQAGALLLTCIAYAAAPTGPRASAAQRQLHQLGLALLHHQDFVEWDGAVAVLPAALATCAATAVR